MALAMGHGLSHCLSSGQGPWAMTLTMGMAHGFGYGHGCVAMRAAMPMAYNSGHSHGLMGHDPLPYRPCAMPTRWLCRVVGVTGMIEPKIGRKIVKDLVIEWDPEGRLGGLVYES